MRPTSRTGTWYRRAICRHHFPSVHEVRPANLPRCSSHLTVAHHPSSFFRRCTFRCRQYRRSFFELGVQPSPCSREIKPGIASKRLHLSSRIQNLSWWHEGTNKPCAKVGLSKPTTTALHFIRSSFCSTSPWICWPSSPSWLRSSRVWPQPVQLASKALEPHARRPRVSPAQEHGGAKAPEQHFLFLHRHLV